MTWNLVTTVESILAVDFENKEVKVAHQGEGLYFGMAQHEDRLYVASRNSPRSDIGGKILVFDSNLDWLETLRPGRFQLWDLHGIGFWKDKLLCTCCWQDAIAVYHDKEWSFWRPFPIPKSIDKQDFYHWNTVSIMNDSIYLLAHNMYDGSFIAEFKQPFSPPERIICNIGIACHDLWSEENKFFTLSSEEGVVRSNDGFVKGLDGWPRGIVQKDDCYYVGISPREDKKGQIGGDCKIIKYNNEWEFIDELVLNGEGQIFDMIEYGGSF